MLRPVDLLGKPPGFAYSRSDAIRFQCCAKCGKPFDEHNVRSPEEKAETRISGVCGPCFDEMFGDEETL